MPRLPVGGLVTTALSAAFLMVACGGDDGPGPVPQGPAGPGSGAGGPGSGGDATGGSSAGGSGAGGNVIPNTDCVALAGPSTTVFDAADGVPPPISLVAAGSRWAASGGTGYYTFDGDGSAATAPTTLANNFNEVIADGDGFGVIASSQNLIYRRFDANGDGAPLVSVGTGMRTDVTGVRTGSDTLLVWADNTKLRARLLNDQGFFPEPAFDLATAAWKTFVFMTSASSGTESLLVWTSDAILGANEMYSMVVAPDGSPGERKTIYASAMTHSVQRVVALDDGYAVLLTDEAPEYLPALLKLDAAGDVVGSKVNLAGAQFGHDIAAVGNTVAVVASRATGEPELRVFDLSGGSITPVEDWVCLEMLPDPMMPEMPGESMAVGSNGSGFAALYKAFDGSIVLARTDVTGVGTP